MMGETPQAEQQPSAGSNLYSGLPLNESQSEKTCLMNTQIRCNLSENTIAQVIERILASGKITRADQISLQRAMSSENPLSVEETRKIKRVFERLQMGLLKVVD